jgi:hypothetical protein
MNIIESYMTPGRQILTEKSINLDSGVSVEIQDFCWDFRCHRLLSWTVSCELKCISHVLCYNFLWFRVRLAFQHCIWICDWIDTYLYRVFLNKIHQRIHEPLNGYWYQIFTPEMTQNEAVRLKIRLKILTDGLNTWTDGLNRWIWSTVELTVRLTEIPHYRSYNITIKWFKMNLENPKWRSSKCHHHGREHFSVHRDQFLTDFDTRGLDPRLGHCISSFPRVTSGIRSKKIHLSQQSRD